MAGRALHGARTLELGCGLALPSMAAVLAGARVLATDWSPAAVELARENADRNGIALEVLRCSWDEPEELLDGAPWDLVLGADLLYEQRNADALLELLPRLRAREIWIADPGRAPASGFFERARERFEVEARTAEGLPNGAIHRLRERLRG